MTDAVAAAVFAVGAGAATFFSPCAYALLPGYVAYYVAAVDEERAPLAGATARGLAAAVGAALAFGALSLVALAVGEALGRVLPVLEVLVGVALVALGVLVLWRGTLSLHVALPARRAGVLGFGAFGAMYAVAAAACVLPLFLAVAIQSVTFSTTGTALVLGAYAGTFAALMLGVTVATAVGHGVTAGRLAPYVDWLTKAAGVVLILAGFGQLYVALAL